MAAINSVGNALTGLTGSGLFVGATSPSLVTPALGTPTSGVLSSCTGYAQSALTGLGTGVSTALGTNVNGSGAISLTTSPTFVTPVLGAATATSINFGGTSLANYVQASWTPTLVSTGGGTATYSLQQGTYTRVGNRVMFNAILILSALPSSGTLTIEPLPIAAASNSAAAIFATDLQATATTQIMLTINASSTAMNLYNYVAGTANQLTVANCTSTSQFWISGQYDV